MVRRLHGDGVERSNALQRETGAGVTVIHAIRRRDEELIGPALELRISSNLPIHWNDSFCSDGRVGALVDPAIDRVSGQPEFKHPARVAPFSVAWHGVVLSHTARDERRHLVDAARSAPSTNA